MTIISIHIFPHELTEYNRVINLLSNSVDLANLHTQVEVWVTLNINPTLIRWDRCPRTKNSTLHEFDKINHNQVIRLHSTINETETFYGVNDHRRLTINEASPDDTIIFLDSDLYFNKHLLEHQLSAVATIKKLNEYFIITPQTIKLWDTTWDCIVNPHYKNHPTNYHKTANVQKIVNQHYGDPSLEQNTTFKWAGGWFNCISANLLKYVGIPTSFVGYGPDDTFLMECCKKMKIANMSVQQYILTNMIVAEDKTLPNPRNFLAKDLPNFRDNCNTHFSTELTKFRKKL